MGTDRSSNGLTKAIDAAGGVTVLAKQLGVTSQAVSQWRASGIVPAPRVLDVERITGVPRHELNPVIYPPAHSAA